MARVSGALGAEEAPESYLLRQENELQVLESIYGQDFRDLRQEQPWKVASRAARGSPARGGGWVPGQAPGAGRVGALKGARVAWHCCDKKCVLLRCPLVLPSPEEPGTGFPYITPYRGGGALSSPPASPPRLPAALHVDLHGG